jgi:hypothetical protein
MCVVLYYLLYYVLYYVCCVVSLPGGVVVLRGAAVAVRDIVAW